MTEVNDNSEFQLVREIVPASQLGVGDSVAERGLVVSFVPTDGKVFVGYGSMRGDEPDVETTVEYDPTEMVERAAVTSNS